MAKKQITMMIDVDVVNYIKENVEGVSLSAKVNTALREYKALKETNNSTGIEKDLLTLTNTVKRITEYISKDNKKPITETKQVTTNVEEKKEDMFNDDEFDFDYKDEELE